MSLLVSSVHEGLTTADGGSSEVVVVDEANESVEGVGDLGGEEEDVRDVGEEAEGVEDEHQDVVGSEDGPGTEEDVEEDATDVVGGPGLLLLVVNEHDEGVEEDGGNEEGDDVSNGQHTEVDLPENGVGDGETGGDDGEGESELLESLGGHGGGFLHIRYGFVLNNTLIFS